MKRSIIAIDTETGLIRPRHALPELVCLTTCAGGEPEIYHQADPDCYATIKSILLGEELIVAHRAAYDLGVLAKRFPDLLPHIFAAYNEGRILCTYVGDKLRNIREGRKNQDGASLKDLTKEFYGYDLAKGEDTWRLRYGELLHVPISKWEPEAKEYALDDAVWHFAVYLKLAKLELADWERQSCHAFWAELMGDHGVMTDPLMVDEAVKAIKLLNDEDRALLIKNGMLSPKGPNEWKRNTKIAKDHMIKVMTALGAPYKTTDTGGVSLDEDATRASGDPTLKAYSRYVSQNKRVTDLERLYQPPIQSQFMSLIDTGRMSCRIGKNTNGFQLHNPPRKGPVRECFIARPGKVFLLADLDTAEMRSWAQICLWICGFSRVAEALNKGIDPHLVYAADLLAKEYAEAKALYDAGDKETGEARDFSKIPNFGFMGGMGPESFVEYCRISFNRIITLEDSKRYKATWKKNWTEEGPYFKFVNKQLAGRETATITQFLSGRVRGGAWYTEIANGYFQGLTSDLVKSIAWRLTQEGYVNHGTSLFGLRLWNTFHDEFMGEIDEEQGHEAAIRLREVVEDEGRRWIPDVASKTTPVLTRRWYKGAKPVYLDGRLVPSKPQKVGDRTVWVHDPG